MKGINGAFYRRFFDPAVYQRLQTTQVTNAQATLKTTLKNALENDARKRRSPETPDHSHFSARLPAPFTTVVERPLPARFERSLQAPLSGAGKQRGLQALLTSAVYAVEKRSFNLKGVVSTHPG
jgi:hypothetical protein